jgi:sugar phosphate isomerase/epimerase
MKLGAKTYDDKNFLKHFDSIADFFEVQAIQTKDYSFIKEFDKPIVIHAEHQVWGINNASEKHKEKNLKSIRFAQDLAKEVNAKKIIIHQGNIIDKNCSREQAVNLLNSIDDKRILIENLIPEKKGLCTTPNETKRFLKEVNKGFILDINHAIESAIFLEEDYICFLRDFIRLNPAHYHIGGQSIIKKEGNDFELRAHLSFSDSNIDLKSIFEILPKDAEITLEVTTDIKKTEYDFNLLKKYI